MEFSKYQLVRRVGGNRTKYSSVFRKKYAIKKCWSDEILCYNTMAEIVKKMGGEGKKNSDRVRGLLYHYRLNKSEATMLRAWDANGNEEMVWIDWDTFIEEREEKGKAKK